MSEDLEKRVNEHHTRLVLLEQGQKEIKEDQSEMKHNVETIRTDNREDHGKIFSEMKTFNQCVIEKLNVVQRDVDDVVIATRTRQEERDKRKKALRWWVAIGSAVIGSYYAMKADIAMAWESIKSIFHK